MAHSTTSLPLDAQLSHLIPPLAHASSIDLLAEVERSYQYMSMRQRPPQLIHSPTSFSSEADSVLVTPLADSIDDVDVAFKTRWPSFIGPRVECLTAKSGSPAATCRRVVKRKPVPKYRPNSPSLMEPAPRKTSSTPSSSAPTRKQADATAAAPSPSAVTGATHMQGAYKLMPLDMNVEPAPALAFHTKIDLPRTRRKRSNRDLHSTFAPLAKIKDFFSSSVSLSKNGSSFSETASTKENARHGDGDGWQMSPQQHVSLHRMSGGRYPPIASPTVSMDQMPEYFDLAQRAEEKEEEPAWFRYMLGRDAEERAEEEITSRWSYTLPDFVPRSRSLEEEMELEFPSEPVASPSMRPIVDDAGSSVLLFTLEDKNEPTKADRTSSGSACVCECMAKLTLIFQNLQNR